MLKELFEYQIRARGKQKIPLIRVYENIFNGFHFSLFINEFRAMYTRAFWDYSELKKSTHYTYDSCIRRSWRLWRCSCCTVQGNWMISSMNELKEVNANARPLRSTQLSTQLASRRRLHTAHTEQCSVRRSNDDRSLLSTAQHSLAFSYSHPYCCIPSCILLLHTVCKMNYCSVDDWFIYSQKLKFTSHLITFMPMSLQTTNFKSIV